MRITTKGQVTIPVELREPFGLLPNTDVATDDPVWGVRSIAALARHAERSILVINPIIYAEVSVGFDRVEALEAALPHR